MRVDVETRGQFTRVETAANRHNAAEHDVPHEGRLWVAAIDPVQPNVHVAEEVEAERFLRLRVSPPRRKVAAMGVRASLSMLLATIAARFEPPRVSDCTRGRREKPGRRARLPPASREPVPARSKREPSAAGDESPP